MIQIDWFYGLAGGLLIGLAAVLMLLGNGRIMGASGIIGSVIDGSRRTMEQLVFIAALIGVPGGLALLFGGAETHLTDAWPVIVIAGLLVGYGTRLGSGCTSGHGVCGISRLSVRGIVATLFYLAAGALTVALARHVLGVI